VIAVLVSLTECTHYYIHTSDFHRKVPSHVHLMSSARYPTQTDQYMRHRDASFSKPRDHFKQRYKPELNTYHGSWNQVYLNNLNQKKLENEVISQPSHNVLSTHISDQSQEPIVKKHVYFHVPPDEVEDKPTTLPTPTEKKKKIVFIESPSHPSFLPELPEILTNQYTSAEGKPVVYVLMEKSELPQELLSLTSPKYDISNLNNQIIYVKYGDSDKSTSDKNSQLLQINQLYGYQSVLENTKTRL
jgi:hypothetical protein